MKPPPVESGVTLAVHNVVHRLRTEDIALAPYPAVALALELQTGPRARIAEVVKLVASDAALAASTLRLAGAAGTSGPPPTLQAAIQKVGFPDLYRHVLSVLPGARARVASPGPLAALRREHWRRALVASALAAELARPRSLSADVASLAALLHDLGAMVVAAAIEQLGPGLPSLPPASWRVAIEAVHVEIGEVVSRRWRLADPIVAVIAHHHALALAPPEHRLLVALIATIDTVIDVLDADPDAGVGALSTLEGLLPGEPARIAAVVPRIARMLHALEHPTTRGDHAPGRPPSRILADGWPASFEVVTRGGQAHRAVALSPNALAFHSTVAMPTSWLAELTLASPPDALTLLANVTSCDAVDEGLFLIVARPFGLDGAEKATWLRLLTRTRPPRATTA